jgi:hypothetical protein
VVVSGTDFHRPHGQTKADDQPLPAFSASKQLDIEVEMVRITRSLCTIFVVVVCNTIFIHFFSSFPKQNLMLSTINNWR